VHARTAHWRLYCAWPPRPAPPPTAVRQARDPAATAKAALLKGAGDGEAEPEAKPRITFQRQASAADANQQAAGRKLIEEDEADGEPGQGRGTGNGTGTGQHSVRIRPEDDPEAGGEHPHHHHHHKHGLAHRLRRRLHWLSTHFYVPPNSTWCAAGRACWGGPARECGRWACGRGCRRHAR
jgi:hypothetical protein